MCVTTDHLSKLTQIVCNHQICLHKFCVIITEMLFTQSNVYNKVRFTHEIVNDSHRLCRMVDGLSLISTTVTSLLRHVYDHMETRL